MGAAKAAKNACDIKGLKECKDFAKEKEFSFRSVSDNTLPKGCYISTIVEKHFNKVIYISHSRLAPSKPEYTFKIGGGKFRHCEKGHNKEKGTITYKKQTHFMFSNDVRFNGWTCGKVQRCGADSVCGGYNVKGKGDKITKKFDKLEVGKKYILRLKYNFIDSWDNEYGL